MKDACIAFTSITRGARPRSACGPPRSHNRTDGATRCAARVKRRGAEPLTHDMWQNLHLLLGGGSIKDGDKVWEVKGADLKDKPTSGNARAEATPKKRVRRQAERHEADPPERSAPVALE